MPDVPPATKRMEDFLHGIIQGLKEASAKWEQCFHFESSFCDPYGNLKFTVNWWDQKSHPHEKHWRQHTQYWPIEVINEMGCSIAKEQGMDFGFAMGRMLMGRYGLYRLRGLRIWPVQHGINELQMLMNGFQCL